VLYSFHQRVFGEIKMAAKKKANTGSANAAEKRVMDTKKKAKAVGQNRNDQAGRSGMGETATSNLKSKSAGGKKFVSAAEENARAAAYKAVSDLKKSGKKATCRRICLRKKYVWRTAGCSQKEEIKMAAKKAPAKKMAAPKKTGNTADSSKLTASQKKNLAASAKARTDKTGSSGMGMTKSGVEARAKSAGYNKGATLYPEGIGQSDRYSGLTTWMGYKGTPTSKGKKISDAQANKIMLQAENKVRKNYGVKPKKK
jgi:hypothetical protein